MENASQDKEEEVDVTKVEDMDIFEILNKRELEWEKKHPFRAYIRDYLDKIFPKGLAGGYRAYYVLQKPWKILHYWKSQLEFAWQRVFRGWDDRAEWNFDTYLAKLISQVLKQMKREDISVPMNMFDGLPYEDEKNYSYSEETIKIAQERWNNILDKIILGFEGYLKYDYEEGYVAPNSLEFKEAFKLLEENFESLWD